MKYADGLRLARPCTGCSTSIKACGTRLERDEGKCCWICTHPTYADYTDDQEM